VIWVLWALVVPVSGLVTGGGLRAGGVPRRTAIWAGVAAGALTGLALFALGITVLGECLNDTDDPPASYSWAPRREFCDSGVSAVRLGILGVLFVPTVMVVLGTLLRARNHPVLGGVAYATLLAVPFLPGLYVSALPYYRLDDYPALHRPLLRPAKGSQPPRVCYLYGIAVGPRKAKATPATTHHCVDLEPTPEARSLTPRYDEGRTIFDLEQMGNNLTEEGLPIEPGPTGVDGLVVDRAYVLRDGEARRGAALLD
jgi:hypothetical protein